MKLLKLVVRTLLAHPFTATDGLATLRGAKAVALPARARMTEVFILQIYPLLFLLSKSHDDMSTSLDVRSMQARGKKGPSGST